MFNNLLAVAIGGAAGSMLRYVSQKAFNFSFPYGTLGVNVVGCLLIGLFWGWFSGDGKESTRLLLMTGFCGGFTTFSAFSQEGLTMLLANRWPAFILYTTISVAGGLLATFAGYKFTT